MRDGIYQPGYVCDLHCHTNRSDGKDTPKSLIDKASAMGMKVIAITDHDVKPPEWIDDGRQQMPIGDYAAGKNILIMAGSEISCDTEIEDVHIVAFGCDFNHPKFRELEEQVAESKIEAYKTFVDKLNRYGFTIDWNNILYNNGNPIPESKVQKKMIFNKLADLGYVSSWKMAKVVSQEAPELKVKRRKPDPEAVVRLIKALGGVSILAHPKLIRLETEKLDAYIQKLIDAGLDGIEAMYNYQKTNYVGHQTDEEIRDEIIEKYAHQGLIISGGSDYHGDSGKPSDRHIGERGLSYEQFVRLGLMTYGCRTETDVILGSTE